MTKYDDRILEYLREKGSGSSGQIVEYDYIYCSPSYVSRRLKELEKHELVEALGNGIYVLDEKGRAYLIGGYDVESGQYLHEIDPDEGARNYQWLQLKVEEWVDDAKRLVNNDIEGDQPDAQVE